MGSGPGRARLRLSGEGEGRARVPQSLPRCPPSSDLSPMRETEGQKGFWATAFRSHPEHQGITHPQGECADQPALTSEQRSNSPHTCFSFLDPEGLKFHSWKHNIVLLVAQGVSFLLLDFNSNFFFLYKGSWVI